MKLKKIASLMLAGIMAVSMLAACGEGKKDDGSSSSSTPTVQTNAIASAMNAKLSAKQSEQLKFESNAKLAAAVEAGAKKVAYTDIQNAGVPTIVTSAANADIINAVADVFDGSAPAVTMKADTIGNALQNYDQTFIWTYLVDGSLASAEMVANAVVNGTNGMKDMFYEAGNISGNTAFTHSYKGYAEMIEVTNDNTGDSCYLVAVMVEKTSVSTGKN